MFRGVNALNLDAKGRMAMPSRYRERLADLCSGQLVVTVDRRDPCLLLYPLPEWEDIELQLIRTPNQDAVPGTCSACWSAMPPRSKWMATVAS